jgi:hypothetical protein
LAPQVHQVQ